MDLNKKEEKENRMLFSAMSYQTETVVPDFKEDINKDWVRYGIENKFPEELINLFNKSGIHNAIIESKVRMMVGDGIIQAVPEEEISDKAQMFIDNPNPYESMTDIYKKCSYDFEIFGLAYLEIIWGKGRKQIAEINHIDASKIRWGKREKGRVTKYYYSEDWSNYRKEYYKPIEIELFNNTATSARQILPIVRYTPSSRYYAFPDYIGGIKWIEIDTEIANFHFNNLKNGLAPSMFFGFPVGDTTNEEREAIEAKINEKYSGTNQAGKFLLAFYDAEGDKKPEVTVMENSNADKQYDLLNTTTLQQILIAHKVNNENLVGISTPGKLGGANEILENYELYFNTVVQPEQQAVLAAFQRIMLINGFTDIEIQNNKPISANFSENIMAQILSRDEMREILGFAPEEVEDETIIVDNNVTDEDEEGFTINNKRYEYDFASSGVRSIDATNAFTNLKNANLGDTYVWRTRSDAKNGPCKTCVDHGNRGEKTLTEWLNIAIPGTKTGLNFGLGKDTAYPTSPYGTWCEQDCQCRLVRVKK